MPKKQKKSKISATELRANVYQILDEAMLTGEAVAIYRSGQTFWLVPPTKKAAKSKLKNLPKIDLIVGDPEDLVHMDWSSYWHPDEP